jgi:thiamine biosynthesis protein ThiS
MSRTATEPRTVSLTVNGEPREIAAGASVADLLRSLALDPHLVVVEHNRAILHDRSALHAVPLAAGDTIEIVHFVGGG